MPYFTLGLSSRCNVITSFNLDLLSGFNVSPNVAAATTDPAVAAVTRAVFIPTAPALLGLSIAVCNAAATPVAADKAPILVTVPVPEAVKS